MSSYVKDNELIALIEPLLKVKKSSLVNVEKPSPNKIKDSEHSKRKLKRVHAKTEETKEEPKSAQEPEKARFGHITLKLISVENFDKVMIYVP